ncbi:MAG: MBG domain-containing protein, partial [Chitinophagaceae bacterium]
FAFVTGKLAIGKATLTVSAQDATKKYGDLNPVLASSIIGFVNNETLASSGLKGQPSVTTQVNAFTPVGTYDIEAGIGTMTADNYTFAFEKGKFAVTKATVVVIADNQSKVYGTENPNLTATYSGFMNGEDFGTSGMSGQPDLTTEATAASKVDLYTIYARKGSLNSNNYDFIFKNGTLVVRRATITVTADAKRKIYGSVNPAFTASYAGFVNNEALANSGITGVPAYVTSATASSPVGNYDIEISLGTLSSDNYSFVFSRGNLAIDKATLQISAQDKSRLYGIANPEFTYTYNGFVNNESIATSGVNGLPALSTVATPSTAVGTYDIDVNNGSLSSGNYQFAFVKGKLNIGKSLVTVYADNKNKIYGQANPALTSTLVGLKNGETLENSGITGVASLTTTATVLSGVGIYDIQAQIGTLSSGNYEFSFVKGSLAVQKASLTVTADNKSKVYGSVNPAFTVTYNGFVNNETPANAGLIGAASLTTTASASSAVGTYPIQISAGTLASANYNFTYLPGSLTIGKATLKINADAKVRTYGMANPTLTATYSGFVNGESLATSGITGKPALATIATPTSAVGIYPIKATAGTLASGNYTFDITGSSLTVNKAT